MARDGGCWQLPGGGGPASVRREEQRRGSLQPFLPPRIRSNRGAAATSGRRDRFERLLTAGLAIFAEHELEPLLQRIADAARDIVGARYAALGVLTEQGTGLAQFVSSGLSDAERAVIGALPQGRGLLGLVIRERRPIRLADLTRHPERFGFPPHHPPMRSFLGVPIILRDRVFGNLYLTEKLGRTSSTRRTTMRYSSGCVCLRVATREA